MLSVISVAMIEHVAKLSNHVSQRESMWNNENKIGPRIDPWGTPQVRAAQMRALSSADTRDYQLDQYEEKQLSAEPDIPTHLTS